MIEPMRMLGGKYSARLLTAALICTTITSACAAQAGEEVQGFTLEWLAVAGVFSGTLWRARQWFTDAGFQRKPFRDDALAISALCFISLGLCEWWSIHNFVAGLVGTGASLLGIDFLTELGKGAASAYARLITGRKDGASE